MVAVLDRRKRPLMPCTEKRARQLLASGRARVHRVVPFVIRLVDRRAEESTTQPVALKLDPGATVTGLALVREPPAAADAPAARQVLHLQEIEHRGARIRDRLHARRAFRHRRRTANLRYRPSRFDNRRRPAGWLPPSLRHRIETTTSWVTRWQRWTPVTRIAVEVVRFDTQALANPEVAGVEYQQGQLAGYEVREYLLEKWGRRCAYCDVTGTPLQVEHMTPKARGGSDRLGNLTLACPRCNQRKGAQDVRSYLAHDPARLTHLLSGASRPLASTAAVNVTRLALRTALAASGVPVEASTGGRTKWNRARLAVPKGHALDAACVGAMQDCAALSGWGQPVLVVRCMGRGAYQRTRLTAHGFPRGYLMRAKSVRGFRTGDLVRATLAQGVHAGCWRGRIAVRATGSCNIQTRSGVRQGIRVHHCRLTQRADGYDYATRRPCP